MTCLNTILNKLSEDGYFVYENCISGVDLENLSKDFLRITSSPFPKCCRSLDLDVGTGVSVIFGEKAGLAELYAGILSARLDA